MNFEITPAELKAALDSKENLILLDVRTPEEFQFCNIGGENVPLEDFVNAVSSIPADKEIITICHHGIRSARAAQYLLQNGFEKVRNLRGGLDRWSLEVDPTLPRY